MGEVGRGGGGVGGQPQRQQSSAAHSLWRLLSAVAELAYMSTALTRRWAATASAGHIHDNSYECARCKRLFAVALVRTHEQSVSQKRNTQAPEIRCSRFKHHCGALTLSGCV